MSRKRSVLVMALLMTVTFAAACSSGKTNVEISTPKPDVVFKETQDEADDKTAADRIPDKETDKTTTCETADIYGQQESTTKREQETQDKNKTDEARTTDKNISENVTEQETTKVTDIQQQSGTPVEKHGALKVNGANLTDKHGNLFQLYGMSTHGIAWFPQYINYEAFKTLRDEWNTNCIRLAMYTAEYNGYCTGGNKEELKELVRNGVNYATELGMYVIIDWHVLQDCSPGVYKAEAIEFFKEMSALYADYDNVIYEICNEPNSWAAWDEIKSYANEVIPVIRANDSDAVIIVGTPTWSQDIDKALASPLEFDNVMYSLHFYAATHTDWLRERARQCINSGLPVFVSEFGLCDASGNGGNDFYQSTEWMNLIKEFNLSYCCWNLANKGETSSVIQSWCNKTSWWNDNELSESGNWIKNQFKSEQ